MRRMYSRKQRGEGDPKGWSTVLVTSLGSVLGKPVARGHGNNVTLVSIQS
jgi:hypothetical protein